MRVTLDFPAAEEILQEVGLDEQGDAQMFHTKNVLRRVQKYMPYRTGATIKLTVAQTDPRVPEIVTEEPQAVCLYNGVSRSGKPLNHKIGFIGLGLIGGSIAKAIRQYYPDYEIVAFDKNKESPCRRALGSCACGCRG